MYFLVVEGMALSNSVKGDTLSEHVWAFLGLNHPKDTRVKTEPIRGLLGGVTWVPFIAPLRTTTGWTWLRRLAVAGFMTSLGIHFVVGSHPLWNGILITASVVLATTVLAWWAGVKPWKR